MACLEDLIAELLHQLTDEQKQAFLELAQALCEVTPVEEPTAPEASAEQDP